MLAILRIYALRHVHQRRKYVRRKDTVVTLYAICQRLEKQPLHLLHIRLVIRHKP